MSNIFRREIAIYILSTIVLALIGIAVDLIPAIESWVPAICLWAIAFILLLIASVRIYLIKEKQPQLPLDFVPEGPYTVSKATSGDILWITNLVRFARIYSELDQMPYGVMMSWYKANPNGFYIIKDTEGRRCGNLDLLPLRPGALARILNGDVLEREIRGEMLFGQKESNKIKSLYIESFVIHPTSYIATYRVLMNIPEIVKSICDPSQIESVYAIAASESGERFMLKLGFTMIDDGRRRKDCHKVYFIEFRDLIRNLAEFAGDSDRGKFESLVH